MSDVEMRRSPLAGVVEMLGTCRPVSWFLSKTLHLVDTSLLRLIRGRVSIGWGYPVLLLTTTGGRSGRQRTVTLLSDNRTHLEALAALLIKKREANLSDMKSIFTDMSP